MTRKKTEAKGKHYAEKLVGIDQHREYSSTDTKSDLRVKKQEKSGPLLMW